MHLSDEQIQRVLHGELAQGPDAAISQHLLGCTECRQRVLDSDHEEARRRRQSRRSDNAA